MALVTNTKLNKLAQLPILPNKIKLGQVGQTWASILFYYDM